MVFFKFHIATFLLHESNEAIKHIFMHILCVCVCVCVFINIVIRK